MTREEFCHHADNPDALFECSVCAGIRCEDLDLGLPKPISCVGGLREILADTGDCGILSADQIRLLDQEGPSPKVGGQGVKITPTGVLARTCQQSSYYTATEPPYVSSPMYMYVFDPKPLKALTSVIPETRVVNVSARGGTSSNEEAEGDVITVVECLV